jgi:hypothetical protein
MHDMTFKSLPLFTSMNHPNIARVSTKKDRVCMVMYFCLKCSIFAHFKEKINLYSQFPSYLNIEPDGNSHLVVFYNSNPSGKNKPIAGQIIFINVKCPILMILYKKN